MKIVNDPKKLLKSYSVWAMVANILSAASVSALAVLGVISYGLAFPMVVGLAVFFGVLGVAGRFLKQDLEEDGQLFWEEDREDTASKEG
ncbi:MAG: hypothetical protein Tp178MES00d2C33159851_98 [Prokaryotic dsDNA virus sp.]|nr:MAG: hypothetical protein Tp178MES00d2C33159851_98 [Prokaryotic dsDNA virus sp.]|tara:strand:+ start:42918 stop:43184 length:267 start_codon:yes stop_codon:yes gene_type:complete